MTKFNINTEKLKKLNNTDNFSFPKYTTQIINIANQNAGATRPKNVGQLSELFPLYLKETAEHSVATWRDWYIGQNPEVVDIATDKIMEQIEAFKIAIQKIDRQMVKNWTEDLLVNKTYDGNANQIAILTEIANREGSSYVPSTPEEEAKGIDGWINGKAYSVKPDTYKSKDMLPEEFADEVRMVYYTKKKSGISVEY